MTIYATPTSTTYALADFQTGLVGTIGITILRASDLSTIQTRRTSGITENGATGLYVTAITAPATMGTYLAQWDDGAGGTAVEELVVNATATTAVLPTGSDLCTLADVRAVLQSNDTQQDSEIQQLIPAASQTIMRRCEREFAPATDGATRILQHYGGRRFVPLPYDLRAVTSIVLPAAWGSSVVTLVEDTDYAVGPLDVDGVLSWIELPRFGGRVGARGYWRTCGSLEITGDWGYPAVPLDVTQAAAVTVASWLDRGTSSLADLADDGFDATPETGANYGIPTGAYRLLAPFMRLAVA